MAYEEAFLSNNQELIFDTGSERVDLTQRVAGGGWSMALGDASPVEYEPLTRRAAYRIASPTDWGLGVSGMYYGPDVAKMRAVAGSSEAFALGLQYSDYPIVDGSIDAAYFLCGFVKTEGLPLDGTSPVLSVSGVTLAQGQPLVYGEHWHRRAIWASPKSVAPARFEPSTNNHMIDFGLGLPVLCYDLRGFTGVTSQVAGVRLKLNQGVISVWIQIPVSRPNVGFIDLAKLPFSTAAGTGITLQPNVGIPDWPTIGMWKYEVTGSYINDDLDIGFGYGYRQVTD